MVNVCGEWICVGRVGRCRRVCGGKCVWRVMDVCEECGMWVETVDSDGCVWRVESDEYTWIE